MLCIKEKCTGCCACISVCPKNAIRMKEDDYGFKYPVIDKSLCISCGLCSKTCEKIQSIEKQQIKESYIFQSKNKELLLNSSSGGIFGELAQYFLSANGIVIGATMKNNGTEFVTKHIFIDNKNNLNLLQGSKYCQSDICDSYLQVKKHLEDGKKVLFSGTPCQVAGLKSFLKKDFNNLLTVDISCEGVPSQKFFNDYVKYLEKYITKDPIVDIKFRDKKDFNWYNQGLVILSKKHNLLKKTTIPKSQSSYFSLFYEVNILRESCYSCNFTGLERVADITIADAWGSDLEIQNLLENGFVKEEGLSLVFLNTSKGKMFFEKIQKNGNIKSVNPDAMKKYNHPLRHPSLMTKEREEYLEIYKNLGYYAVEKKFRKKNNIYKHSILEQIKELFFKDKADCLLLTMYDNPNYGSVLASYSLWKTLKNLGYKAKIIHHGSITGFNKLFYKQYCDFTSKINTIKDFKKLNKISNTFILGSDNLINLNTNNFVSIAHNLLNFTESNKKRIMISGSIGDWNGITNSNFEQNYMKSLLNRFDYISTREEHGKNIFKTKFGCNADWINDPIFYLSKNEYQDLVKNIKIDYSNKIMAYILYPKKEKEEILKFYQKKFNLEIETFDLNESLNTTYYMGIRDGSTVENWLKAIIQSKIIITDSFHCIAFAIMFNKPFICLKNSHAQVRFTSLFNYLEINPPLISSIEDLNNNIDEYNYKKINLLIEQIRLNALNKIDLAMKKKKKHNFKKLIEEYIFWKYNKDYVYHNLNFYVFIERVRFFISNIFSVKNEYSNNIKRKVFVLLGIKIKLKI